jgi:hypothetical protein
LREIDLDSRLNCALKMAKIALPVKIFPQAATPRKS